MAGGAWAASHASAVASSQPAAKSKAIAAVKALIPAPALPPALDQVSDPTGCGDVFGGAVTARLLGGAALEDALRTGTQLGTRNLSHRGATGLRDHLMGKLSVA